MHTASLYWTCQARNGVTQLSQKPARPNAMNQVSCTLLCITTVKTNFIRDSCSLPVGKYCGACAVLGVS